MANKLHMPPSRRRYITSELVLLALAILSGALVIWMTVTGAGGIYGQIFAGALFTLSLLGFVRLLLDPDSSAARQSDQPKRGADCRAQSAGRR